MSKVEYLKKLYELSGYKDNPKRFNRCINSKEETGGKGVADRLASAKVYDHLNILIQGESRKIPRRPCNFGLE